MSIKNQLTNSSIRKYLPSKVISGYAQTIDNLESWLYDDGTGDPWWQGTGGTPVRWILTADVFSSTHSSHLTRAANMYTGLDIAPGMWVFSNADPKAVRIVSVISKTDSSIRCLVEDVDRYNTFTDPTSFGVGIFAPSSNLIFFELGDDGLPILNPLPANTDIAVVSQVEARFRVFNPTVENRFFQLNHGFQEGQVLKIDSTTGKFVHATSNDLFIAGTVMATGPGPNYFYLSPSTKIIQNLEPGLPGQAGDIIWIDPVTGDRTTTATGSMAALYIKMTNEVPCFTVGGMDNPSSYGGTVFKLNNVVVTLPGSDPVDALGIIAAINEQTPGTGVVASMGSPDNLVVGTVMYPMATPAQTMTFKLNGVLTTVSLPSVNFGTSGQVGWWDVIRSVNEQTHLHGVYASFDPNTGFVSFDNAGGDAINFENIVPLTTSGDDKTVTDMVGVSESNPASAATRLKLVRQDGGQITLSDVSGSFVYDSGLQSAANGELPLALVVDKTMGANASTVVADLPAMNALTNMRTGDQVFVMNGVTPGEWELYVRTGNTYTKIADQNSANSDANTLTVEIDHTNTGPVLMGNVSDGTRIADVTVVVVTPFNASATLDVGTSDAHDAIFSTVNLDLTVAGTYEGSTSFIYEGTEDGEIYVYLDPAGSATGSVKVMVSYL